MRNPYKRMKQLKTSMRRAMAAIARIAEAVMHAEQRNGAPALVRDDVIYQSAESLARVVADLVSEAQRTDTPGDVS